MAAAPAERATLPGAAAVYGTAALLHAEAIPTLDAGMVAGTALPGVMYGIVHHVTKSQPTALKAAAGTVAGGIWLSAASRWGVLSGPDHVTSLAGLTLSGIAYGVIRHDQEVRARRQLRHRRASWRQIAAALGLAGSHLLRHEHTRLGEKFEVDVTGTGRRASQIACKDTEERIAELRGLPATRISVRTGIVAGRIVISVRSRDPWAHPIPHPLLDELPEIELEPACSIRDPLVIGQDPETGNLLEVRLWDEDHGAERLLIVAVTGGGKTVLVNDLTERLTACSDAVTWAINVSKAKEERRWKEAYGLAAVGPAERKKALRILRLACKAIDYRGAVGADAVHQPSPQSPLIAVRIDEMHQLVRGSDALAHDTREAIGIIASTGRSEGVGLVAATQRGVAAQMGGADIRAMFTKLALLKVRSAGEMHLAAGEMGLDLPNMAAYGENHPGVLLLADLDGDYSTGRTFHLKELHDLSRLAEGRRPPALEPGLVEYLGDEYQQLLSGDDAPVVLSAASRGLLEHAEAEMASEVDPELAAQMDRIRGTNERTREGLAALTDPGEGLPPETRAKVDAELARRRDAAALTVLIPAEDRGALLLLLRSGTSVRRAARALRIPQTQAYGYLDRLRAEGVAEIRGRGRGAGYWLAEDDPDPGNVSTGPYARGETFNGERSAEAS